MENFASLRESQDLAMIMDIDDYASIENLVIEWYGEKVNTILRDWILKDWYGDNSIYIMWEPEIGPESALITSLKGAGEIVMFTEHQGHKGMTDYSAFMSRKYLSEKLDHCIATDDGIELCNKDGVALLSI